MGQENYSVAWEISADETFRKVVGRGEEIAQPGLGHSVHAEVSGLEPSRWYWYRFSAGGHRSPAGRFRTAPAPEAAVERLRIAVASCQHYTHGLYTAYEHMAQEELDLILHLGDYIYEKGDSGAKVRSHQRGEIFSLDDYRHRYALYKSDEHLQKAHAHCPWLVTWDDHEVSNNYANDIHETQAQTREEFLERRANAYQAYYEHMPLRRASLPRGSSLRLHRRVDFGSLARIHMLDTRQYRTDQPCGDALKPRCADVRRPGQTMLGADQERWLARGLAESPARWNILGQQVMVTYQDFDPTEGEFHNMDSWSGYELARERLVESLERAANPVILTGDVHSNWCCELRTDPRDVKSKFVAPEFVSTSISSAGDGADTMDRVKIFLPANPQVRFFNAQRGYLRCEITPKAWRTDYRVVDYVTRPGSPVRTRISFTSEAGRGVPELT